jgi:hypothetical protein
LLDPQRLRIVKAFSQHPGQASGVKDHSGRDDRSGERSAANLIYAADHTSAAALDLEIWHRFSPAASATGPRPEQAGVDANRRYVLRVSKYLVLLATFVVLLQFAATPVAGLGLFDTHEVTAQFATADGKPMADAEARVFAPGDPKTPVATGRTDSEGKFVFGADRDGFWSAEARGGGQVARIMIRVGGEAQPQNRISPFLVIGVLAILLAIAIWYRLLRARSQRRRS